MLLKINNIFLTVYEFWFKFQEEWFNNVVTVYQNVGLAGIVMWSHGIPQPVIGHS
jgi:hypothetical protein